MHCFITSTTSPPFTKSEFPLYKFGFNPLSSSCLYPNTLQSNLLNQDFSSRFSREKMALCVRRSYAYSRVDNEDPDEKIHRRAQFLINKVLEQADYRRKPSFLRIRLRRLKVKIGKRLRKLRKSMVVSLSAARVRLYKKILSQLKAWKLLFSSEGTNIVSLPPPLFT